MTESSYDEVPYEDFCFPATHPEHLQAMARLFGHAAPDFARARVLEIGCARGANLVPMAADLSGARFLGVDPSARQIDAGVALAREAGVDNVALRACSATELDAGDGEFDYVLCHGVYSWVPADVRAGILRVARERLSPLGVIYVSYNVLPGWSTPRTLRDYLLLNTGRADRAGARIAAARESMAVLTRALAADGSLYARALRAEIAALEHAGDAYLFHEYLESVNEPCYLVDFVRAAEEHGLGYLADAEPAVAALRATALSARPHAGASADPIALEQQADFLRNRRFRASLLVHAERAREVRPPTRADLAELHLASRAELAQECTAAELRTDAPLLFELDGARVPVRGALSKCALVTLAERARRPIAHAALVEESGRRAGIKDRAAARARFAAEVDLLAMLWAGLAQVAMGPARYAADAGLRPRARALTRLQAARGATVTTGRHTELEVPAFERALLALLDGARDRAALARELGARVAAGELALADAERTGVSARRIEEALDFLGLNALLIA